MTKNIQVSFRLTPYQLAHGLEIIQSLEPSYHPVSLSAMVKLVFNDYLAKMSVVSNPWPSEKAIEEIKQLRKDKDPVKANSDDLILQRILNSKQVNPIKQVQEPIEVSEPDWTDHRTDHLPIKTQFDFGNIEAKVLDRMKKDTVKTKSVKNTVTDFSPPNFEDLTEEEN